MDTGRKSQQNDQLHVRIGSAYLAEFNAYIKKTGFKKVQFIRDALSYWMSVDGSPNDIQQTLEKTQLELQQAQRDIEYLNQILNEKERMILFLQDQIQRFDGTHPIPLSHVNRNKNIR